ncbi:hypothetical protein KJN74_00345 [Candidatus Bathyarchaeota archaeon]|nr:hypothetical protein [Candidatus Bathyarchaeota archaeon]
MYDFQASDQFLREKTSQIRVSRKNLGLEGLVGSLNSIIINTEPDKQKKAIEEILSYTGFEFESAFETNSKKVCVLKRKDSADILVTSRSKEDNPFLSYNNYPKSKHLPNTRLETFVFEVSDIKKYVMIQENLGKKFLTPQIIERDNFYFIQTLPSKVSGNSIGLIQWKKKKGKYQDKNHKSLEWDFIKPDKYYLNNIGKIDHAATRVESKNRDLAIVEFMSLTNYNFDFAIYVKIFNSITSVARLSRGDFAMVFTSGIAPFVNYKVSGPTETYIQNFGPRVHHVAYETKNIENTFSDLVKDEMKFLINLVGSKNQGLKQTFSVGSEFTLLVNEYIHRYGDFDGFFTKDNVTLLTGATKKQ